MLNLTAYFLSTRSSSTRALLEALDKIKYYTLIATGRLPDRVGFTLITASPIPPAVRVPLGLVPFEDL